MTEQLDQETFTGAHPTAAEFVARLGVWGFRERPAKGRRGHEVHQVFRGPHGGTVRVLRSRLGRADPDAVAKAARLARVDVRRFWAGPDATFTSRPETTHDLGARTAASSDTVPAGSAPRDTTNAEAAEVRRDTGPLPQPDAPPARDETAASQTRLHPAGSAEVSGRRRSCAGPTRDQITSLVLAAHTSTDRPLGFDQVVQLCHSRVTRDQVRTASAALCRDGHLDRIRSAVYQWSGGRRATVVPPPAPTMAPAPSTVHYVPGPRGARDEPPAAAASTPSAADLFELLFPGGVQMTGELLSDFERWAELTAKLAAHSQQQAS